MNTDTRPILTLEGDKRGKRIEWAQLDETLSGCRMSYQYVSTSRDGRHETVTRTGYLADGRRFRTRERYAR